MPLYGEISPVADRQLGGALQARVDRQRETAARNAPPQRAQGPDRTAERVDGDAIALETAVQQPVVLPLDARLADHLAEPGIPESMLLQLILVDLTEQAQELRPERSLRVAAHRQRRDVH